MAYLVKNKKTKASASVSNKPKVVVRRQHPLVMLGLFMLFALSLATGFASVYAWLSGQETASNIINTPSLQVNILEGNTATDIDGWDPQPVSWNNEVPKYVRFSNSGQSSILLRASFAQTWKQVDPQSGAISYLSNTILKGSATIKAAQPQWALHGLDNAEDWWYNAQDGWYYYRLPIAPGESTPIVLDSVYFDPEAPGEYDTAQYDLFFQVEACQYSLNPNNENLLAAQETFGVSFSVGTNGRLTWSQ